MKFIIKRIFYPDDRSRVNEFPWKLYVIMPNEPKKGYWMMHQRTYQEIRDSKKLFETLSTDWLVERKCQYQTLHQVGYDNIDL